MSGDARSRLNALIETGDVDGVLAEVERLVEIVIGDPSNTAEIFANTYLDECCQWAGAVTAARIKANREESTAAPRRGTVFLASRLQDSGGHTALMADIASFVEGPVTLLLTGTTGRTRLERIFHRFGRIADCSFEVAPAASRSERLSWIQQRLMQIRPEAVWLFNHHQDSVAVGAVQEGQGYLLNFVHHGDHHLCLGVMLSFSQHYDPHPMGWRNCREVLNIPENRYLPLVVSDPGPCVKGPRSGALVTATAARGNKLNLPYFPSYSDIVADVLSTTGGIHWHIGYLSLLFRLKIYRALWDRRVPLSRFKYVPYVRSVAEKLNRESVDLYISSFPYAGARTLVEVMAAGVPVVAHAHAWSRFLSAIDMLPPGAFVWRRFSDLRSFLLKESRDDLFERGRLGRLHYEQHHSEGRMGEVLRRSELVQPYVASIECDVDPLSRALERSARMRLGVVGVHAFRSFLRRTRSRFF